MLTLKIQQMTIDGHPYTCPECASEAFTLDGTGFVDAFPVMGNCWQSHSWEDPLITLGMLKEIKAASTGRARAEDDDVFEVTVGGAVLAGILYPDVTVDDIKQVWTRVYWRRLIKPAIKRRKRAVIRAAKQPVRNGVAAAKAAALGAAWGLQAGGHEPDPDHTPEPINPCPACRGKGHHAIESRLHGNTHVRCSVCHGTGEIE
ncbi:MULTISPECIES: zinc finger-like domain-containing protein [unclassified Streptomyces]|uniref:zinc finger-like domain-containing protein n=1 Tax=unclassified Streptomyces TaxID=2593676 RepID=UPI00148A0035|nr:MULTISPECIES: zinc finger-like domain-containing protein [unclassified Streptomyces]